MVLAAALDRHAPGAPAPAHADRATAQPRHGVAAAPAAAADGLTSSGHCRATRGDALTIAALGAWAPAWAVMDALVIKDLRKVYANGVEALKGIDLTVREGDFFALLGPNGAGKTTAIGIVTSLIRKTGGSVTVFGHDLERERDAAKACIGVVPQEINLNMFERNDHTLINQAGYYGVPSSVAAGAHGEVPQGAAPLGQAHRHRANAVGRHEAPAHDRARARPRAAAPDPRRADGRRRHRDPPLDVGLHARDQREGHDDHLDDALPRGSGEPVPQRRDHRRRPHHRERRDGERHRQAAARGVRAELARARRARRRRSRATRCVCATSARSRSRSRRGRG